MSAPRSDVWIARHGETEWNVAGRRQGRLDSPLTTRGVGHARQIAEIVSRLDLDSIFTSPTGRAAHTAAIIGTSIGLTPVVIDDLAEIDIGTCSGLTDAEIDAASPGSLAEREQHKYTWRFPGGESYADTEQRARRALAHIDTFAVRRSLVVTHQMFARSLLKELLAISSDDAMELRVRHGTVWHVDRSRRTHTVLDAESPS